MKKMFSFANITSIAIAFLLSFGLMGLQPAAAATQVAAPPAQVGGGSGTLAAQGRGVAWVRGSGTFTISGTGALRIRDWSGSGDAQSTINGTQRNVFKGRWSRYGGFRGTATVTGTDVMIELTGVNINMSVSGTGNYVLRGQGTYTKTISGTTSTGNWVGATENLQPLP